MFRFILFIHWLDSTRPAGYICKNISIAITETGPIHYFYDIVTFSIILLRLKHNIQYSICFTEYCIK